MLINTSRGRVVDTRAVIGGLESREFIDDDLFMRLLTFPNVLITGHQGFFTREALTAIAQTTLSNITAYENGRGEMHSVTGEHIA